MLNNGYIRKGNSESCDLVEVVVNPETELQPKMTSPVPKYLKTWGNRRVLAGEHERVGKLDRETMLVHSKWQVANAEELIGNALLEPQSLKEHRYLVFFFLNPM